MPPTDDPTAHERSPRPPRRRARPGAPRRGAGPADAGGARPGQEARPHDGRSARQGADHRPRGPGLPEPPPRAHRRPARLPPRAVRGAPVHGLVGARRAPAGRRDGALSAEPRGAAHREPPAPRDAERHPARRGGRPPPLPRGAAPGGAPPEPQPARRGDPRRDRGGAPAGRLPRAPRARRRRVHLGEGLVRLQPDRAGRLPRHRRTHRGAAPHALPHRRPSSLSPPRRAGHAEVHQPRHGGIPRPRPHGHRVPSGAGRAGVPGPPRGNRAPGLSARLPPRAARPHRVGDRTSAPRRGADQAAHRQGREPGDGAHRGGGARLAPGALPDQGRGRRQLQADARVRLPAGARGGRAPRRRQPQPLRHRLRPGPPRGARGRAVGRVRDARGHGQPPGAGGAGARGRAPALRARRQGGGLPQRHRLPGPPARREHARPRTSCATSSTSSPARRTGTRSAIASSRRSASRPGSPTRPAARRTGRPRRAPGLPSGRSPRRSPTIPTPTGPSRRTARGSRPSRRDGGNARRTRSRSRSAASCVPASGRRRAAIPRAPAASRTGTRWAARPTSSGPSRSPRRRRRRGPTGRRRSARLGSRRARPSSTGAAAISSAR